MYVVIIEVGIKDLKPRLSYLGVLTTKQLEEFQFVYICSLLNTTIFKEIKWFDIAVFYV